MPRLFLAGRRVLVGTLLIVLLAWPALYNGQPIFFPDTTAYIRGADAGFQAALHRRTAWSLGAADSIYGGSATTAAPGPKSLSSIADKTILTGRSPFYGLLLYLGEVTGGFWLSIAIQSLAVVLSVALVLSALRFSAWPRLPLLTAFLAVATSAPFFVSFLMPDVFAAVAILGATVLISVRRPLARRDYCAWFVLLSAATSFHDSHVLIVTALLILALVWNVFTRDWSSWRGMVVVASSIGVALLCQLLFTVVVERVVGVPPLRPPFLMARVIADGPGYRYLRATCPSNGFSVCRFLDRLPLSADDFLWGREAARGAFFVATPAERRQLAAEQFRFVLAVVRSDPLGQLSASLKNAAAQLMGVGYEGFQYQGELQYRTGQIPAFAPKVPEEHLETLKRSRAYRGQMPVRFFSLLDCSILLLGVAAIVLIILQPGWRSRLPKSLLLFALWTVLGVVVNSAICGVFSGPHDRYSQRVAWLIPLVAALFAAALLDRRVRIRSA